MEIALKLETVNLLSYIIIIVIVIITTNHHYHLFGVEVKIEVKINKNKLGFKSNIIPKSM